MVDREKWERGQRLEREWHKRENKGDAYEHYKEVYKRYFEYLDIKAQVDGIIEVGPADYPALLYLNGANNHIIEPLPSDKLKTFCKFKHINLINSPAEDIEWPIAKEAWFFNVLQHVLDPEIIINKAKEAVDTIRYFEPIDLPTDLMHFHSFTIEDYRNYFGDAKLYDKQPKEETFHKWCCAYGIWRR